MRYRRLSPTGDYTFGQSAQNFVSDQQAVTQAINTRLQLLQGSFWRDTSDGLPLFQNILGTRGDSNNLAMIDGIIKDRIIGTPNVQTLTTYSSSFNPATRGYSFQANAQTAFSQTSIVQGTF